jgi:multisubunit Na+/H+ antiporter MnhC subunit
MNWSRVFIFYMTLTALFLLAFLYITGKPDPDAGVPALNMFLFVMPPFAFVLTAVVILFSLISWFTYARYTGIQEVALSEQSVSLSGGQGTTDLPWTKFDNYKETPWHILLYREDNWLLLPKRAFHSWEDRERCDYLLERHLTRTRWFEK